MRKIKKLVATLLAATMVMAMGVTAFAADSLADGKYTAKQNLYKNSACTTTSMGDAALNDMRAEIKISKYVCKASCCTQKCSSLF